MSFASDHKPRCRARRNGGSLGPTNYRNAFSSTPNFCIQAKTSPHGRDDGLLAPARHSFPGADNHPHGPAAPVVASAAHHRKTAKPKTNQVK
jgi:hypothetical protein